MWEPIHADHKNDFMQSMGADFHADQKYDFTQGMGADSRKQEVRFHTGYGSRFTQTRSTISRRVWEPIHADQKYDFT